MNLIPWNKNQNTLDPFTDMLDLDKEISRFFGMPLERDLGFQDNSFGPEIDIRDTADSILIKADLPGMDKKHIHVSIEGDTLYISGERKRETKVEHKDYVREERSYGEFRRAFRLPDGVDTKNAKAKYTDGVLELMLPKTKEAKPKQIQIEVN